MAYDRVKYTVIYERDGERYKLCKIFFGNDGSYYVTSPYHPAEGAVLFKATVNYALDEMEVSLEQALDVAAAEDDEKRINRQGVVALGGVRTWRLGTRWCR
jgi:hypothetical protein